MIEDIVLHVGPPKTGSTTIQKALFRNAQSLERKGVYVPRQENATCILLAAGREKKVQRNDEEEYLRLKDIIQQEGRIHAGHSVHKIIISCEFISGMSAEELIALGEVLAARPGRTRIVMYLRNPNELYRARVQELLKKGFSYRMSAEKLGHRNRTVFDKLAKAFPGMVAVRHFKSELPGWDVLTDFERVSGVESLGLSRGARENVSMSLQAGIALDALSGCQLDRKRFREVRAKILKIPGDRFEIDMSDHMRWRKELKEDIDWCNNVHGTDFTMDAVVGTDWRSRVEETLAREDVAEIIREYNLYS